MADVPDHLTDLFNDEPYMQGPSLTPDMVQAAEAKLGYRLPPSYLAMLQVQNGGYFTRTRYPVRDGKGSFEIEHVFGIGPFGIDGEQGSKYLIQEWSYPDVGVVFSSDGHTAYMLDYRECGPQGEPRVLFVTVEGGDADTEVVAPDFETFVRGLRAPKTKQT